MRGERRCAGMNWQEPHLHQDGRATCKLVGSEASAQSCSRPAVTRLGARTWMPDGEGSRAQEVAASGRDVVRAVFCEEPTLIRHKIVECVGEHLGALVHGKADRVVAFGDS
jgi:hypothetical protein